jgi:hypothetical protein
MPKIPSYESENRINVPNLPEMGTGSVNASAQAQKGIIDEVKQAEEIFTKIKDFRQVNESSALALEKLNDIHARADQDLDLNPEKYNQEIDALGQTAGKTISSGAAKAEFMAGFQRQAIASKFRIRTLFHEKELKNADAIIDYQGQQILDGYGGMDEAQRITTLTNYRKQMENAVNIGLYNKGTADLKWEQFNNKLSESDAEWGILNNPTVAMQELQKGKEGNYPDLPTEKRVDFIRSAESRIAQIENKTKEAVIVARNKKEADLIDLKMSGELTEPMVRKARDNEEISARYAETMIEALRNPRVASKTKDTVFNNIVEDILNPKKKPEDIRVALLGKSANKELSDEDFNTLYTFNQMATSKVIDEMMPQKRFMFGIKTWVKDNSLRPEATKRLFDRYMKLIAKNESPESAMTSAIKKEVLHMHPKAASYPKEGQKTIDIFGVVKKILPSGDIQDAD